MGLSSDQLNQFWKTAKSRLGQPQCAPITSIMTPDVKTLSRPSTLQKALQMFREHNLRHLVVVNNHFQVQDIFTKRDLLAVENRGLGRSISTVANSLVRTTEALTCIREVAQMMLRFKIGCVPIVKRQGQVDKLVGIVTESDFVRAFAMTTQCECGVMDA